MVLLENDLKNLSVLQLKKLCKLYKITNYSKLRKRALSNLINYNLSILKLQRFFRSILMEPDAICPISMEPISYPCYPFKPKGSTKFVYYNLEYLIDYLLQTGDFRDPKTREPYRDEILQGIDKYKSQVGIRAKSVYKASQNRNIYKRKRDHEDDIMVLERCIDEVTSSIRSIMEGSRQEEGSPHNILNSYQFPTFLRYYKKLLQKCPFAAESKIKNTIMIITGRPDIRPIIDPYNLQDFILQFLLTVESTYEEMWSRSHRL